MKNIIAILGLIVGVSYSGDGFWTNTPFSIKEIASLNSGNIVLRLETNTLQGCDNGNQLKVYVGFQGVTTEGLKGMHSTALSAFVSGQKIIAYYVPNSGDATQCYVSQIKIVK